MIREPVEPIGWPWATRTAVYVYFAVIEAVRFHCQHGDHGKGLVNLPQIYVISRPTGFIEQRRNGINGCQCELRGQAAGARMCNDLSHWL